MFQTSGTKTFTNKELGFQIAAKKLAKVNDSLAKEIANPTKRP